MATAARGTGALQSTKLLTMAKSSSFFGLRRGSTKSLTFQVYRGQQITKDRVSTPSNPQSLAQMKQRLKLPLVANARSILSTLVNHSYEGVTYGDASLKYFSQANLESGKLTVSEYVPKGASDCGLADFLISKGTLDPFTLQRANGTGAAAAPDNTGATEAVNFYSVQPTGEFVNPFAAITRETLTKDGVLITTPTNALFVAIGKLLGLEEGDQITFLPCSVGSTYNYVNSGVTYEAHYHRFTISRLICGESDQNANWKIDEVRYLKSDDASPSDVLQGVKLTDGYISVWFGTPSMPKDSTNDDEMTEKVSAAFSLANATTAKEKMIESAAVILSRKVGTDWKRSTQRMTLFVNPGKPTFDMVLPTYVKSGSESAKYLNSGADSVAITGGSAVLSSESTDTTTTNG